MAEAVWTATGLQAEWRAGESTDKPGGGRHAVGKAWGLGVCCVDVPLTADQARNASTTQSRPSCSARSHGTGTNSAAVPAGAGKEWKGTRVGTETRGRRFKSKV